MTETVTVNKDDLDLILQCITLDQRHFSVAVSDAFDRLHVIVHPGIRQGPMTLHDYLRSKGIIVPSDNKVQLSDALLCQPLPDEGA